MGTTTEIAWTDSTWNPVVGCTHAGPECDHCYARESHDKRHRAKVAGKRLPAQYLEPFSTIQTFPERLDQPLHWREPRRIFVCSTGDLFHRDVPLDFILRVFTRMGSAGRHTFQVLTKQPARMLEFCRTYGLGTANDWPANVWAGVTAGTQESANERIPLLMQVPAAVRFVSVEPMLGPMDLRKWLRGGLKPFAFHCDDCDFGGVDKGGPECADHHEEYPSLDWLICGGESGAKARPFDLAWARAIVGQCEAAGVPCFVKQLGRHPLTDSDDDRRFCGSMNLPHPFEIALRSLDGRDPDEWPQDLRVQQFPEVPSSNFRSTPSTTSTATTAIWPKCGQFRRRR